MTAAAPERPGIPGGFCSLCGNTNLADLGRVIGICLDADACHRRQAERKAPGYIEIDRSGGDLRVRFISPQEWFTLAELRQFAAYLILVADENA